MLPNDASGATGSATAGSNDAAETVTSGKTCAVCGKAFYRLYRWKHLCPRCHAMVCRDCYLNGMLPEQVLAFDYDEKYPICRVCFPIVQNRLAEQDVQCAIKDYESGFVLGECDGNQKADKGTSLLGVRSLSAHYMNGYEAGYRKGVWARRWQEFKEEFQKGWQKGWQHAVRQGWPRRK